MFLIFLGEILLKISEDFFFKFWVLFESVPEWSSSSCIPSSRGAAKNVCLNIVTEFLRLFSLKNSELQEALHSVKRLFKFH